MTPSRTTKDITKGAIALLAIGICILVWELKKGFFATPTPPVQPLPTEHISEDVFSMVRGTKVKAAGSDRAVIFIGGRKYTYMKDPVSGIEVFIPVEKAQLK